MVGAFIHPKTVSSSAEILYEDAKHFQDDLDRFARHVVAFALAGTLDAEPADHFGRVVAIYGDWGSGKSTALGYLRKKVLEFADAAVGEAPTTTEGATPGDSDPAGEVQDGPVRTGGSVRFQELDAREWEPHGDPRSALAYSLLVGAECLDIQSVNSYRRNFGLGATVSASGQGAELAQAFFDGVGNVSVWPLTEQWVRENVRQALGSNSALVLLIENLDRCSAGFVSGLLAAIDGWLRDECMPVFFVVASSREHILQSLADVPLGRRSPEETLEKYVHTEIYVPSLLSDSPQVARYLERILQTANSEASASGVNDDGSTDPVSTLLTAIGLARANGEAWSSVLFPLTVIEERDVTPRRAVDRLNKLLGTINVAVGALTGIDADKARRALKLNVIRAFWPDFYHDVVRPLELTSEGDTQPDVREGMEIVREIGHVIERARRSHVDGADARSEALLEGVTSHVGLRPNLVDTRLARYLAMDPPWPSGLESGPTRLAGATPPANDSDIADRAVGSTTRESAERNPSFAESDLSDLSAKLGDLGGPVDLDDQDLTTAMDFTRAYLGMDAAIEKGSTDQALRALNELVSLVTDFPDAGFDAAQVGNAALRAERLKALRAALVLHLAANRIDPDHPNVAQNLADFLLDSDNFVGSLDQDVPLGLRLARAQSLLDDLEAKHPGHKPWRTAELSAKLASLKGEGVDLSDIQAVVDHFHAEPSFSRYLALVRLHSGGQLSRDEFMGASKVLCSADPPSAPRVLRVIADELASEDANEKLAADIYLMLFEKGVNKDGLTPSYLHDTWNNLAYALRSAGFPNAGLRCMVGLHLAYPTSVETRARLARMLSADNQPELAVSVFDGKVPPVQASFSGLPPAEVIQTPLTSPPEWWWDIELPAGDPIDPVFRG